MNCLIFILFFYPIFSVSYNKSYTITEPFKTYSAYPLKQPSFEHFSINNIVNENNNVHENINEIKKIKLNTTNNIVIKGEINEKVASEFIYDLNIKSKKNNILIYLDTPGGSVDQGMKIVKEIQKYNLSCIAETAYSMGFIILQSCNKRYILSNSKLMQHQMSFGIADEKYRVENYIHFIDKIEKQIIDLQVKRINITVEDFKQKIINNWWIYGENAFENNVADELVEIFCSAELTKKTFDVEKNGYKYIYSKCPLVTHFIKKEKLKNSDNTYDIYPFIM